MATSMATLVVWCPACGAEREVSRAEVLAGRWKDACPSCPPEAPAEDGPAEDSGCLAMVSDRG